jgi:4-aminobutyrate aminotransferase
VLDHCPASEVAALFVEPIQSDAGVIVPPDGFLRGLAERCRRSGILLVCDEVKVGLGRTGTLHGFQRAEIAPDLVTFGKGLGGGLPLSAMVGPAEVLDASGLLAIQTTAGNPACASAGLAVLRTIGEEALAQRAQLLGSLLVHSLREALDPYALVREIRGGGLVVGVEMVREDGSPASVEAAKVVFRASELGAVMFYVGVHSNVIELTPPLTLTEQEVEAGIAIFENAVAAVAAGRVRDAEVAGFAGW